MQVIATEIRKVNLCRSSQQSSLEMIRDDEAAQQGWHVGKDAAEKDLVGRGKVRRG